MGHHIVDGQFQSDKYPWCKPGFVPLKITDPDAHDLLLLYAQRRREVDADFAADLETALDQAAPNSAPPRGRGQCTVLRSPETGRVKLAFSSEDGRECTQPMSSEEALVLAHAIIMAATSAGEG